MSANNCSEILFLGTGAGDWQSPLENGFFRHQSCVLVDQNTLIDCPGHALSSIRSLGKQPEDIAWLLITHSHGDHFCQDTIFQLARCRLDAGRSPLTVCAHKAVIDRLQGIPAGFISLSHGQFFETENYVITPMEAMHTPVLPGETPLHYLMKRRNGPTWLYATDGAWMTYPSWCIVRSHHLDGWIVDATVGDISPGDLRIFEHNSIDMVRLMLQTFQRLKVLRNGAPVILTHMARTLHSSHEQVCAELSPPFVPAYDGLKVVLKKMPDERTE